MKKTPASMAEALVAAEADADAAENNAPHRRGPRKKISTGRNPFLSVRPQKVWLDEPTRERIERLHSRIAEGLGVDASLSVMVRVAMADFEHRVRGAVPTNPQAKLKIIQPPSTLELKIALLAAARGQL